ncbi:MAG: aminoacyl-tRNA hydrolase [Bacillota bacterium]
MKCVVGLGNPGRKYANTRHNVGYMALRELAGRLRISFSEHGFSEVAKGEILLVKPLTYMNASGQAVSEVARDYGVSPADILVIHDDMDLPFGKIRIRRKGSSGGHKGIESIAAHLGTTEFPRIKIGVGRPPEGVDPVDFVLEPFSKRDAQTLEDVIWLSAAAAMSVFAKGIDWAMGEYNGQNGTEEDGANK